MTTSLPPHPVWSPPSPVPTSQLLQLTPRSWWKQVQRRARLSYDLAIDLGTSNLRIYVPEQGIVVEEPSVLASDKESQQPLAYGTEALPLVGRTPLHVQVHHPIRNGNIADLDWSEQMLRHWMEQAQEGLKLFRPRVAIGASMSAVGIERDALIDVVLQAGAREVRLIDQSVAAALGSGVLGDGPMGHLVVDIGGGTTDVAVISMLGIVASESIPIAGEVLTKTIQQYIRHTHRLEIGMLSAERLKRRLVDLESRGEPQAGLEVGGLHLGSDNFSHVRVEQSELQDALTQPLASIVSAIRRVLERTPVELLVDICDRGILLTGGGSLLTGLDQLISQELGMLVHRAADPLNAVALGTGYALEHPQNYERLLTVAA